MFSDELVCIDASGQSLIKEGQIYPLLGYSKIKACGCNAGYVNVGTIPMSTNGEVIIAGEVVVCNICRKEFKHSGIGWLRASRFAPIDSVNIEELTSILSEEPFKV